MLNPSWILPLLLGTLFYTGVISASSLYSGTYPSTSSPFSHAHHPSRYSVPLHHLQGFCGVITSSCIRLLVCAVYMYMCILCVCYLLTPTPSLHHVFVPDFVSSVSRSLPSLQLFNLLMFPTTPSLHPPPPLLHP